MNKKILGIKLGTILACIACLFLSVVIWLLVKYFSAFDADKLSVALGNLLRC